MIHYLQGKGRTRRITSIMVGLTLGTGGHAFSMEETHHSSQHGTISTATPCEQLLGPWNNKQYKEFVEKWQGLAASEEQTRQPRVFEPYLRTIKGAGNQLSNSRIPIRNKAIRSLYTAFKQVCGTELTRVSERILSPQYAEAKERPAAQQHQNYEAFPDEVMLLGHKFTKKQSEKSRTLSYWNEASDWHITVPNNSHPDSDTGYVFHLTPLKQTHLKQLRFAVGASGTILWGESDTDLEHQLHELPTNMQGKPRAVDLAAAFVTAMQDGFRPQEK